MAVAIGRCHASARLPAPRRVVWVATPDDVARFPGPDAAVVTELPTGAILRVWRWLRPLPALVLGPLLGVFFGLMAGTLVAVAVGGIRFWGIAIPLVGGYLLIVARAGKRRPPGPASAPTLARSLVIVAGLFAAMAVSVAVPVLVWGNAFERLSEAFLDLLMSGAALVGAVAGFAVALRTSLARLLSSRATDRSRATFDDRIRRAVARLGRGTGLPAGIGAVLEGSVRAADPFADRRFRSERGNLAAWALGESVVTGRLRRAVRWRRRRAIVAFERAERVSWWAGPGAAVAVDPPRETHRSPEGTLHRLDGPAVVWADGTPWFFLHGVRVPRRPDAADWTVDEIHATPSSEARRVMIEAIGWDTYLAGAGLDLVAEAPDPGNAPHRLQLYRLPPDVFGPLRLLVMTNGSPDRSGRLRRYAEFVPDDLDDPVEAVAWQYDVPVEVYAATERRT